MMEIDILTALIAAIASLIVAIIGAVFTYFSTRSNQRDLERLRVSLRKLERLEEERSDRYEKIWKLTDSLNLFGSKKKVNVSKLSDKLRDWYFGHGWVLSPNSKERYFLIQEVLSFIDLRDISIERPLNERLYGSSERPDKQLQKMRKTSLGIEAIGENSTYPILKLEKYVSDWKTKINKNAPTVKSEGSWMLLQLLLSSFRSRIVRELISFDSFQE